MGGGFRLRKCRPSTSLQAGGYMAHTVTKRKDGRYMAYAALSGGRKAVYGRTEEEAEGKACEAERLDAVATGRTRYIFHYVYLAWFKFKLDFVKPQTMDRIENTYVKYYSGSKLDGMDTR